jgi:hypothetical protein
MARGQSAAVRSLMGRADPAFNEAMDLLDHTTHRDGLHCWSVWPSDSEKLVGRTTFDQTKLRECAAMGRHDMEVALSMPAAN